MIISSKAIKGSVFEIDLPTSGIRNYVVVSDNSYNASNSNCLLALITTEKDSDTSNSMYHVPFKLAIGNMIITHVINCEAIFTFSQKKLKMYKYHLSDDIMANADIAIMSLFFGKQMFTYEQMLVKREEEQARSMARYMVQYTPIENSPADEDIQTVEDIAFNNYGASIDEIQSYYAANQNDTYSNEIDHLLGTLNEEKESKDAEVDNLLDSLKEDSEKKEKIPKPSKNIIIIKSEKKTRKERKKERKAKTKVAPSPRNKKEKKKEEKIPESIPAKEEQPRKYVSRKAIWKKPDEFLLDFCTLSKEELYIKYSINNLLTCNKIRETAIKKAEELGIDISFYYEEISSRGGKINI